MRSGGEGGGGGGDGGGGGGGGWRKVVEGAKPAAAMVLTQSVFGGLSVLYKLSLNDGMDYRIAVAYRYIFATGFITPVAYFAERKQRTKLTGYILFLSFMSGLFGGALTQNFYLSSMLSTTPTYATAIANLIPCCTFLLALIFRLERLAIRKSYGKAKILGTLLGLGGAMLMTFYRGPTFSLWSTNINLLAHSHVSRHQNANQVMGSVLGVLSCLCYAFWLILQAKLAAVYPFPYSNATLMCWMASLQTGIYALCFKRGYDDWRLGFNVRLLTAVYGGIFSCGLAFTLMGWCIKKKGPLYASVFNPLMLVTVAILSSILLKEKLTLGCLLGAILIVIGLYIVLWGKKGEASLLLARQRSTASSPVEVVIAQKTGSHDQSEREDKGTTSAINGGEEESRKEGPAIHGDHKKERNEEEVEEEMITFHGGARNPTFRDWQL